MSIKDVSQDSAPAGSLVIDPVEAAERADLRYVNDDEPGFQRKPWGRGFTYLDMEGRHIKNGQQRERMEALVIPPAWREVWICADPQGHIQATGRDEQGRKQYIYHLKWDEVRNERKFSRLMAFAEALPRLRRQIDEDLRRHGFPRPRVLALVVSLLDESLIRVGNAAYAAQNDSYGLTTLQNEHLTVSGSHIHFDFTGKSGKHQEVTVRNRRLANLVRRCQQLPGQHLFQYTDEAGELHAVTSTDVNDYLREQMGESFSAKDFRTWGGTVLAAQALARQVESAPDVAAAKQAVAAVKEVSAMLGNTTAVCRDYYIHPHIFQAHESGDLLPVMRAVTEPIKGLSETETAVLNLLRNTKS